MIASAPSGSGTFVQKHADSCGVDVTAFDFVACMVFMCDCILILFDDIRNSLEFGLALLY
jgi:hypothetical protein